MELESIEIYHCNETGAEPSSTPDAVGDITSESRRSSSGPLHDKNDVDETATHISPYTVPVETLQRWNDSRIAVYRTLAVFWSMLINGMNDSSLGPLIPYLEAYYSLTYTVISLAFLTPVAGYLAASLGNSVLHTRLGQRGIAILATGSKLVAYAVVSCHPPFPALVFVLMLAGFGNGLTGSGWNAWVGGMANSNEVLGLVHGCYGLGGVLSPVIVTTLVTKANLPWYTYYYILASGAALELVTSSTAFWAVTGAVFRQEHPTTTDKTTNRMKEALLTRPASRITWSVAAFLTAYVGAEVALGGWIVSFMINVRHGASFASGMTATGFWLGITLGRVLLGFVTGRIGEKLAVAIYLILAMASGLIFWLVPRFYVSAVAVSLQGFFLGPLYPAIIVVTTRLLPKHLHIAAIGFAASCGGVGAAAFPFAVGAIAQRAGVKVLQPIILALLAIIWGIWVTLPRLPKGPKRE